nr:MAG TPA: hypothetical protein [Caudoviricetes sp.]
MEAVKGRTVVISTTYPIAHRPSSTRDALRLPGRLEHLWEPQEGGTSGSDAPLGSLGQLGHESLVSLGVVEQPLQRGADPARRLLPLEVPDIIRGLGGEGAN